MVKTAPSYGNTRWRGAGVSISHFDVREGMGVVKTALSCQNARWRGASVSISHFNAREGMGVVKTTPQMERC